MGAEQFTRIPMLGVEKSFDVFELHHRMILLVFDSVYPKQIARAKKGGWEKKYIRTGKRGESRRGGKTVDERKKHRELPCLVAGSANWRLDSGSLLRMWMREEFAAWSMMRAFAGFSR
jgi:hypothetical protein